MTDDARLTDFAPVAESAAHGVDDAARTDTANNASGDRDTMPSAPDDRDVTHSEPGDRDATDPAHEGAAVSTYAWGEYTCSACGDATRRVWRLDGALVCPACKSW